MVRKLKKKTLFFAGVVGLSLLSLFGMRGGSQGDAFTESDLRDLLATTPKAHADYMGPGGPYPDPGPCPSGPCPGSS